MVLKAEKERIKTLISDTVTLLCKNGLNYKAQFSIEAVIGISLDESEEFYLSIKENVKQAQVVEKPNREPAEQSARRSPNRSPVLTPTKKRKHGLLANIKKEVHIKSTPPANFSNSRQANGSHVDQSTSDVIPNLSLGDIQENASEYWSSMTPGGGNDDNQEGGQEESVSVEGSQPPAKRQNRDSSNTSGDANQTDLQQQGDDDSMSHQADVISIKDEPDSDYDESDLQLQEHGGQLSLEGSTLQPVSTPSWMAGLPHSALHTSQGDPQQTASAHGWVDAVKQGPLLGMPPWPPSQTEEDAMDPADFREVGHLPLRGECDPVMDPVTGEMQFICDRCQQVCKSRGSLYHHKRNRHGSRPYVCRLCHKAFYSNWLLRRHLTNNRGARCRFCLMPLCSQKALMAHVRTVHSATCPCCQLLCFPLAEFIGHLTMHMNDAGGPPPGELQCPLCGSTFADLARLIDHVVIHATTPVDQEAPPLE